MSFEDPHGAINRRGTDPAIEAIAHGMKYMREDIVEMKHSMVKLTEVMTRMAVAEESQARDRRDFLDSKADTTKALEKIVDRIDKTDERVDTLERAAPANAQVQQWVTSAVWAAAGLAVYVVINKLGLM